MEAVFAGALLSPLSLALLGLCVGSFLNVVIHRLPLILERGWKQESADILGVKVDTDGDTLSLSKPRSHCPRCKHVIRWYENVPLASYLILRGRCAACTNRISPRYPLIEVLTGVLFGLIGWRFGPTPVALLWCAFAAMLV